MPKAIHILTAAKHAYFMATEDVEYATRKSNSFLARCGADISKGPNQEISMDVVKQVVFAALDAETETLFFTKLNSLRTQK